MATKAKATKKMRVAKSKAVPKPMTHAEHDEFVEAFDRYIESGRDDEPVTKKKAA